MVISKESAAIFWGFSNVIPQKWNIDVKKGYHPINNKNIAFSQVVEHKLNKWINKFEYEDVIFYVSSPEKTIVELIKNTKGIFNDVLIDTCVNAFKNFNLNISELLQIAKEYKVLEQINLINAMIKRNA